MSKQRARSVHAGPAVRILTQGGAVIRRAFPLDAITMRSTGKPGLVEWTVPGWGRALAPAVLCLMCLLLAWPFWAGGPDLVGPAFLLDVLGVAVLVDGVWRGAFRGRISIQATPAGLRLSEGTRIHTVPQPDIQAIQKFGREYWEFSQYGGWRIAYALALKTRDGTLVVAACRSNTRLEWAAQELARVLQAPLDPK